MERPTLRQLEILAEIAQVGTFRGAGRTLGLSQVAVSDHVRQLEARLGCSLFVRSAGSKPSLSPAGRIVLEHGRNVLFACDALIAAARAVAEGKDVETGVTVVLPEASETKHLPVEVAPLPIVESVAIHRGNALITAPEVRVEKVAISALKGEEAEWEEIAPPVTPPKRDLPRKPALPTPPHVEQEIPITVAAHPSMLSRFQAQLAAAQEAFPDRPISVDFSVFTADAAERAFLAGRADIALFYAASGDQALFPSDYLWSENWSLFMREDHPLATLPLVGREDCADLPVIMPDPGGPMRALYEQAMGKAGLWPAPTVLETDDYATVLTEIAYGEAAFAAFGSTAAQFAARSGLRRLLLSLPIPAVEVRRAISPRAASDPTVAALAGLLQ